MYQTVMTLGGWLGGATRSVMLNMVGGGKGVGESSVQLYFNWVE
jgi:hypothetical protein